MFICKLLYFSIVDDNYYNWSISVGILSSWIDWLDKAIGQRFFSIFGLRLLVKFRIYVSFHGKIQILTNIIHARCISQRLSRLSNSVNNALAFEVKWTGFKSQCKHQHWNSSSFDWRVFNRIRCSFWIPLLYIFIKQFYKVFIYDKLSCFKNDLYLKRRYIWDKRNL